MSYSNIKVFDHNQIDYIIHQKNYSLWRISDSMFDIIKNEHGTYGEFYDFMITLKMDPITKNIINYELKISTDNKEINNNKEFIEETINDIMNKPITLQDFSFELIERIPL